MKRHHQFERLLSVLLILPFGFAASAEVVNLPDPGLQAAIRTALAKPTGDITVADMETLTELDASLRRRVLDSPLGILETDHPFKTLEGLQAARNLTFLDLSGLPTRDWWVYYENLDTGDLSPLAGLSKLITLRLHCNSLEAFSLPDGLTSLKSLGLACNQLTTLTLPGNLTSLTELYLNGNQLTDVSFLSALTSLTNLDLTLNKLTSLTLPIGLTSLTRLDLAGNQLTSLSLPNGLTSLTRLDLGYNQLTSLSLPGNLTSLTELYLNGNQLTDVSFLRALTSLTNLYLAGNQLTSLSLPDGLTSLTTLFLEGNPLTTLVLPKPVASSGALYPSTYELIENGVTVYSYPLEVTLVARRANKPGELDFTLTGPPGSYVSQVTTDFSNWIDLGTVENSVGTATFTASSAGGRPSGFYRVKKE